MDVLIVDEFGRPLSRVANPHPQVQVGQRKMKRPTVEEALVEFRDEDLVECVLESFRYQAQLQGRRSVQAIYTPKELRRRWRIFLPLLLECRFDCGHTRGQALQVAGERLIAELFGMGDPVVPVYVGGQRVDSGRSTHNPTRVTRAARKRVDEAEVDDWTPAEREAAKRSIA